MTDVLVIGHSLKLSICKHYRYYDCCPIPYDIVRSCRFTVTQRQRANGRRQRPSIFVEFKPARTFFAGAVHILCPNSPCQKPNRAEFWKQSRIESKGPFIISSSFGPLLRSYSFAMTTCCEANRLRIPLTDFYQSHCTGRAYQL